MLKEERQCVARERIYYMLAGGSGYITKTRAVVVVPGQARVTCD